MEKFTKTNAERYIKTSNDAQVAQLGHLNAIVDSLNSMSAAGGIFKSDFVEGTLGPKVSFAKSATGLEKDVIIPGVLELTRPDSGGGGLINIAVESVYNYSVSPLNTLWSSKLKPTDEISSYSKNSGINYGWVAVSNAKNFDFAIWIDSFETAGWGSVPPSMVMQELEFVMKHTPSDRYWLIKFKDWGQGNIANRSFAYDRWEIFLKTDFVRPPNSPDTIDIISPGTALKRDNVDNDLLYNAYKETKVTYASVPPPPYQFPGSPIGVLWNSRHTDNRENYNGWSNLTTIKNRVYGNLWGALADDVINIPDNLELVMLDQATGYYYTVEFTNWSTSGDGAFSYTRRLIPTITSLDFRDSVIKGEGGALDYTTIANNVHFNGYDYYGERVFLTSDIEIMKDFPLTILPQLSNPNTYYDFKVIFEFKEGSILFTDPSLPYELRYGNQLLATFPVDTLKTTSVFSANSSVFLNASASTNLFISPNNTAVTLSSPVGSTTPLGGNGTLKTKVYYNIYTIK